MAHSESESGWTAYLNTSCDSWVVSGNEDHGVSGEHSLFAANDKYVGVCEEDSTASDASSGPEQPCSQGLLGDDEMQQGTFVGMAIAPKTSSDALYMGAMDCAKMCSRPAKRDRQSTGTVVACSDLEDTASSPVRLLNLRNRSEEPRRRSDAGSNIHSGVPHFLQNRELETDAVKQRFKVLETLVPSVLHRKDLRRFDKRENSAILTAPPKNVGGDRKSPCTLHDKGLCLVPISVQPNAM